MRPSRSFVGIMQRSGIVDPREQANVVAMLDHYVGVKGLARLIEQSLIEATAKTPNLDFERMAEIMFRRMRESQPWR